MKLMGVIVEINAATHLKYQLSTVVPWCLRNMFRARSNREPLDSLVLWNNKRLYHVGRDDESSIVSD